MPTDHKTGKTQRPPLTVVRGSPAWSPKVIDLAERRERLERERRLANALFSDDEIEITEAEELPALPIQRPKQICSSRHRHPRATATPRVRQRGRQRPRQRRRQRYHSRDIIGPTWNM